MLDQNLTSEALVTTVTHAQTHQPVQRPLRDSVTAGFTQLSGSIEWSGRH